MDMPRHFDAICPLSSLQVAKSVGPDELLGALEEFAPKLSPVIQDIYNQSIREGYIPDLLKSSIISPLQKVTPPQSIESDLRGGGGIGFRIVGFHRKNCSDFGSGKYFTRICGSY
jgi:hypothetical protein